MGRGRATQGGEVGSGRTRSDAEASRAVAVAEREGLCQEAMVAAAVVYASGRKGCDSRQHTKSCGPDASSYWRVCNGQPQERSEVQTHVSLRRPHSKQPTASTQQTAYGVGYTPPNPHLPGPFQIPPSECEEERVEVVRWKVMQSCGHNWDV